MSSSAFTAALSQPRGTSLPVARHSAARTSSPSRVRARRTLLEIMAAWERGEIRGTHLRCGTL